MKMREKVALGELCNPSLGQVKEQPDTLIDYIDISSVDNESKSITGFQTMSFAEAPSRARKDIKKNNILVSTAFKLGLTVDTNILFFFMFFRALLGASAKDIV